MSREAGDAAGNDVDWLMATWSTTTVCSDPVELHAPLGWQLNEGESTPRAAPPASASFTQQQQQQQQSARASRANFSFSQPPRLTTHTCRAVHSEWPGRYTCEASVWKWTDASSPLESMSFSLLAVGAAETGHPRR